jgi:hypothetical protein
VDSPFQADSNRNYETVAVKYREEITFLDAIFLFAVAEAPSSRFVLTLVLQLLHRLVVFLILSRRLIPTSSTFETTFYTILLGSRYSCCLADPSPRSE